MGRPVKKWNAAGGGSRTSRMSANAAGDQFMILGKVGSNAVAECTVIAQRSDNRFYVVDSSGNKGIVQLVNKVEDANALNTDTPAGLADGEAIMNCRKDATQSNAVRRVMKLMNRTLIYADDNTPEADNTNGKYYKTGSSLKRAKWSFSAGDRAAPTGHDGVYVLETVQLEEAAMIGQTTDFEADA